MSKPVIPGCLTTFFCGSKQARKRAWCRRHFSEEILPVLGQNFANIMAVQLRAIQREQGAPTPGALDVRTYLAAFNRARDACKVMLGQQQIAGFVTEMPEWAQQGDDIPDPGKRVQEPTPHPQQS
jgi:hypothetical protein